MQQWFYLDESGDQVEVSEGQLTSLVEAGTLTPETHVWYEGLDTWYPCQEILPQLFGLEATTEEAEVEEAPAGASKRLVVGQEADAVSTGKLMNSGQRKIQAGASTGDIVDHSNLIRRLASPLYQSRGWMKLVGVTLILLGIPYILFLGFGILMIIMGVFLFQVAGSAQRATLSGQMHDLDEAQRKLKSFFTLFGVGALLSLIATVLLAVLYAGLLVSIFMTFKDMQSTAGGGGFDPSVIDFQQMEMDSEREESDEENGMVEIDPGIDPEPLEEEPADDPFDFEMEEE
ncbi:MAG: DUF5362 family protein [Verrucomicrobiota bacterium]